MLRTLPVLDLEHLQGSAVVMRPVVAAVLLKEIPLLDLDMHPVQKTEHVKTEILLALNSRLVPDGLMLCNSKGVENNRETTSLHVATALGTEAIMVNAGYFKDERTFVMRQGHVTNVADGMQRTIFQEGVVLEEDAAPIKGVMFAMEFKRETSEDGAVLATSADIRLIGGEYVKADRMFRFTKEIPIHLGRHGGAGGTGGIDPGEPKGVTPPGRRK